MADAALTSLMYTIQRLNLTNLKITNSIYLSTISSLNLDYCRNRSSSRSVINELIAEIVEAAWKLEDDLESYALCNSLPPPIGLDDFQVDEKTIEQDTDSFFLTANKLKALQEQLLKETEEEDGDTDDEAKTVSVKDLGGRNSPMIGLSDQLNKIMSELIDGMPGLKPVSIVGMSGIGKTRLAREIYQYRVTVSGFDLTAWVCVGQKDLIVKAIVDIVSQVEHRPRYLYRGKPLWELMELLHDCLNGRSYLIVLDNMWSKCLRFLDGVASTVPPIRKKRRLLLTTTLEDLDKRHNTKTHRIRFFDNEESWNLLRQNVFGRDVYVPRQLEGIGKKIAEMCEGLPLLILTMADILSGQQKTEEYWY